MTKIKYLISLLALLLVTGCESDIENVFNEKITFSECMSLSNYEKLLLRVGEHLKVNESKVLSNLDEDTYKVVLYEKDKSFGLARFELDLGSGLTELKMNNEEILKDSNNTINVINLHDNSYSYIGLVVMDSNILKDLYEITVLFIDEDNNYSNITISTKEASIIDYTNNLSVHRIFLKNSSGKIIHTYIPTKT